MLYLDLELGGTVKKNEIRKLKAWHIVTSLLPDSLESLGTRLVLYRSNALDS